MRNSFADHRPDGRLVTLDCCIVDRLPITAAAFDAIATTLAIGFESEVGTKGERQIWLDRPSSPASRPRAALARATAMRPRDRGNERLESVG